jgi:hypothetical protein
METKKSEPTSAHSSFMNQTFESICDNLTQEETDVFEVLKKVCKLLRVLRIATTETKDMYDKNGNNDCAFFFIAGGWVRDKVTVFIYCSCSTIPPKTSMLS